MRGKTFRHKDLKYDFQYHVPKLELLCENGFFGLEKYLKGFEVGCPKFFDSIEGRCSQMMIDIAIKKDDRYNNACRLASLAIKTAERNNDRHKLVEDFMLINDSSTVACEVPVWLWEKNIDNGISGHVDVLQIRNGLIYILDFKPDAIFEDEQKVASQLFFYASGLSFRTGIKMNMFRCAWFDNRHYFEFEPAEAKVKFSGPKWRSR